MTCKHTSCCDVLTIMESPHCSLMTLTIIITVAFRTSARLSNAYGAVPLSCQQQFLHLSHLLRDYCGYHSLTAASCRLDLRIINLLQPCGAN